MIEKITIKNLVTEEEILIDKTGSNIDDAGDSTSENIFILDKIDWDTPIISLEAYEIPFQIGQTLAGVKVGTRKPTISGYIVANITENILGMTWQSYYNAQLSQIKKTKDVLNRFISVFEDVEIKAGDYKLKARPSSPVKYSNEEMLNNEVVCYFTLEFECFEPMFYKEKTSSSSSSSLYKTINNRGDIDVGCVMKITSSKTVKGFSITLITTLEHISVDESVVLEAGDYVEINTEKGQESAIFYDSSEDTTIDIISKLGSNSKFIQIKKGVHDYMKSIISSGVGDLSAVSVSFTYSEKYFTIEGM